MLLKQANPEHAASSPRMHDAAAAMDLDPSIRDDTPPDTQNNQNDILDDVFGDEEDLALGSHHPRGESQVRLIRDPAQHPSDVPRLQQEHTTAGYRDGITVAKGTSIQPGFDEGFGLGATIGLEVGRLLGLLEGITAAAATTPSSSTGVPEGGEGQEASHRISRKDTLSLPSLLAEARTELAVKSIFSEAFWDGDGTWKYAVDVDADAGGEVLFSHVADAHPLVKKWAALVEGEMRRWGLREQLPLLERRDDEDESRGGPRRGRGEKPLVVARAKATGPSQGEAKAPSDALSW